MIFRFDDISTNSDNKNEHALTDHLLTRFPNATIIWGVNALTFKNCGQRTYPKRFNAMSDPRIFYTADNAGIPPIHPRVKRAGHGLWHIDHRLLTPDVQEASILTSCSLVDAKIFIPPFNKWNEATEMICHENRIELIKFEDGWRGMEHEAWNSEHALWYLHARFWDLEKLYEWFKSKQRDLYT